MRLPIERLRWGLLAGAALLVLVLAAYIGYGRLRELKTLQTILKRNGISVTHDTNGVTFSQSLGGKTVFTLRTKSATPHGNGTYTLHDAILTMYGKVDGQTDVIYSHEVEYDEKEGVARATGEVQMELQAPEVVAGTPHGESSSDVHTKEAMKVIHVRTSRLVYLRKLGVAATDQPVEFRYGGLTCTAHGAEFNTSQSTLRLLANVIADGDMQGKPVHLTAESADVDRVANIAHLALPTVTSLDREAKSQTATIDLRRDGSIERVLAVGEVFLMAGTRQITGAQLEAHLTPQNTLDRANMARGVVLADSNPLRPMHGTADSADVVFDPQGSLASITATGTVKVSATEFAGSSAHTALAKGLQRELDAAQVIALFTRSTSQGAAKAKKPTSFLSEIHATGAAHVRGQSLSAATKTQPESIRQNILAADDLRLTFLRSDRNSSQPQKLVGLGHTALQQSDPSGAQTTSEGDTLDALFETLPMRPGESSGRLAIATARQTGNVVLHDQPGTKPGSSLPAASSGTAERAVYDGATERLTLSGDVHLDSETASVTANSVTLDRRTHESDASGAVRATLRNASNSGTDAPVSHVLSATAQFFDQTRTAQFHGSDASPARVWQAGSQVEAAVLVFDNLRRSFSARPEGKDGLVHAIFASASASSAKRETSGNIARVASPRMDYSDVTREGVFSGGVTVVGSTGDVQGDRAVAFLSPATKPVGKLPPSGVMAGAPSPVGGAIERIVVTGDVRIEEPGRKGSGEQLTYNANHAAGRPADPTYVLTGTPGHPPQVVDVQQGTVSGPVLMFGDAGSTIVVTGEAADHGTKSGRVHSEAEVKPKKP